MIGALSLFAIVASAAEPNRAATRRSADYVPDVPALAVPMGSELRELVERFRLDRAELERFYDVKGSARRERRMREFLENWRTR